MDKVISPIILVFSRMFHLFSLLFHFTLPNTMRLPIARWALAIYLYKGPGKITLAIESHLKRDLANAPFRLFQQELFGVLEPYVPNVFGGRHAHHPSEFAVQIGAADAYGAQQFGHLEIWIREVLVDLLFYALKQAAIDSIANRGGVCLHCRGLGPVWMFIAVFTADRNIKTGLYE